MKDCKDFFLTPTDPISVITWKHGVVTTAMLTAYRHFKFQAGVVVFTRCIDKHNLLPNYMNGRHELLAEKFWKEIPISHLPSLFSKILSLHLTVMPSNLLLTINIKRWLFSRNLVNINRNIDVIFLWVFYDNIYWLNLSSLNLSVSTDKNILMVYIKGITVKLKSKKNQTV